MRRRRVPAAFGVLGGGGGTNGRWPTADATDPLMSLLGRTPPALIFYHWYIVHR
jgi:hypothetical protein